ncbi:MAG: hypothetical protein N3A01_00445, partial [Bacteroidales bacterium]|nr:hypothetical protein [Bacteroidales bacterium]
MKTNFLMLLILFIYILVQNSLHAQNVGISNDASFTTPQSPLHIYWTSDGNLLQLSRSSAANTGLIFSVSGNNFSINNYQAGNLSLFTNNTERLRIPNAAQILAVGDGTAGAPAWSFVNSTTMGMYRSAADQLSFSTGSTERLRIPNAAQILAVGDGTAAAPAWSFVNSTTMGIYRSAADQLSFSTGSTERLRIPNAAQILAVGDGTAAAPAWSFVNNTTMGMYRSAANQLSFSTNSAERVRINSDGSIRLSYYTSGANGAVLRTNSSGDLSLTNFSGSASDVLLGTGSFGSMNSLAWQLTGNSGTNPTSNFIGTTDAQDFVVRTNNQERIRVLSSGAVRIGYGTNASDALQVGGYGSVNPTVFIGSTGGGAPGYGSIRLYGTTYGTDAIHIRGGGLTYFNTGNQYVFGRNTPVDANDLFSVHASSTYPWAINAYTNVSGAGAIYGQATGALSYGVVGETNNNTSIGVAGYNSSTTANINACGVWGETSNPSGKGVVGINNSTTANANARGVWGQTSNPAGDGGYFANIATYGSNNGTAVSAFSKQTGASAICANLSSDDVFNFISNAAVSGITDATISNGIGVIGACDNTTGVGIQ